MRFKYSLAYPIIIIISLVATVTLCIGYYLNLHSLRDTIAARENDKCRAISRTVQEKIIDEVKELKVYSRLLKTNSQLLDALSHYQKRGELKPVKQVMDSLYPSLAATEVDVFLVTDRQGKIIYRATPGDGARDLSGVWGMEEAQAGKACLTAGSGPLGWTILSLVPLSSGGKEYSILVVGISLTNDLAKKIAESTNTQISFTTPYRILASSWPASEQRRVNLALVTQSILTKNSIFLSNSQKDFNSFYTPITIVDDTICLVINGDTTTIAHLLQEKKSQLLLSLLAVLLATIIVGSVLAVTIVTPLKKLQARSLAAVKEFSSQEITLNRWGNEIETLSQAVESMLAAIKLHLQDLHQAQTTIKQEKLFLDNVFSSIQDSLRVLDLDLTIIRANPVLEQRYWPNPVVGQKCYRLIHGSEAPCSDCPCQKAIETGNTIYQSRQVLVKGKEHWFDIYAYPLRDQDTGKTTGVIEYSRDVTEIKATEEALRQREEQLSQASKMEAVGRLAGGVAHDFNNLLTIISGECELLLTHLSNRDPLQQKVTNVIEAARRAAALTQQLLAFSRKQMLQPKFLDLNVVVARMDRMLRRVLGEDINLVTVLSPSLGTVKVDPHQMEQVILNLAGNARDAMPLGGSLTIETANVDLDESYAQQHADTQPGYFVMLAVSDTGNGLDPANKSRIFEPFFTTKELGQGTGLGLSMVYGIVEQSQGHIRVYSEPEQGTTFKIYLPRFDQPALSPPEATLVQEVQCRGEETILLLEDEEGVRQVVSHMLEQSGYRVLVAADPQKALRLSQEYEGPIHLLFTDVVLPGMSGLDCANLIQAHRPHIKVLFMSGYTDNAVVHHGILEPGIAFINKPFKFMKLARKIRQVLDDDAPPPDLGLSNHRPSSDPES